MSSFPELDRYLRLAGVPADRRPLQPPQLSCGVKAVPVASVMGNRAFMRAWAVRRAQRSAAASLVSLSPR